MWQAPQWLNPSARYAPRFHCAALAAGSGLKRPGLKNSKFPAGLQIADIERKRQTVRMRRRADRRSRVMK